MTSDINKSKLTKTNIITKLILQVVKSAACDDMMQMRQEVKLADTSVKQVI